MILKNVLILLIVITMSLSLIGCVNKTNNIVDDIDSTEQQQTECVFGSDETGYITSKENFIFKTIAYSFMLFQSENENCVVALADIAGNNERAIERYKELISSEETIDYNSLNDETYKKLIDSYEQSGIYEQIEDYTNYNNISGKLFIGERALENESQEYLNMLKTVDENVSEVKSILFVTKECKIISIYSNEGLALELVNYYSYEGTPTIPLNLNEVIQ